MMFMIRRTILVVLRIIIGKICIQLTFLTHFDGMVALRAEVFVRMIKADRTQRQRDENADDHHPFRIASQDGVANHIKAATQGETHRKIRIWHSTEKRRQCLGPEIFSNRCSWLLGCGQEPQ